MRKDEGNSSRQPANTVQPVSEQAVAEQRASYTALLNSLGTAIFAEIEATLAAREEVEPEPGLTPDVVARLRQRIAAKKQATQPPIN